MTIAVFLDRDGTINFDDNLYLGRSTNWKDLVSILPSVCSGIRLLNSIPDLHVFIVTNQSGVALEYFSEERMHEVNRYIINVLEAKGAIVKDYAACCYVTREYITQKKVKEYNAAYVGNYPCIKPNIGMIKSLLKKHNLSPEHIYVLGDRLSDVKLGLDVGGKGILIPSAKTMELGDCEKLKVMDNKNTHQSSTFLAAAKWIKNNIENVSLE